MRIDQGIVFSILIVLVLPFQNCGQSGFREIETTTSNLSSVSDPNGVLGRGPLPAATPPSATSGAGSVPVIVNTYPPGVDLPVGTAPQPSTPPEPQPPNLDLLKQAWIFPTQMSEGLYREEGSTAYQVKVAGSKSGDAALVWTQTNGSTSCGRILIAELRQGVWKPTKALSPAQSGFCAFQPDIKMDDVGNTVVVWSQVDSSNGNLPRILKAEYTNQTWTFPSSHNDFLGEGREPSLAMNNNGDVVVTWAEITSTSIAANDWMPRLGLRERKSWQWQAVMTAQNRISFLENSWLVSLPQVDMNDQGEAVVVWTSLDPNGRNQRVFVTERFKSGLWKNPSSVEDSLSPSGAGFPTAGGRESLYPKVSLNDFGDAVVAFEAPYYSQADSSDANNIFVSIKKAGVWQKNRDWNQFVDQIPNRQTFNATQMMSHQVSITNSGKVTIAWAQHQGAQASRDSAVFIRENAGSWGAVQKVSPYFEETSTYYPRMIISRDGQRGALVWNHGGWNKASPRQYFGGILISELKNGVWSHPEVSDQTVNPILGAKIQMTELALAGQKIFLGMFARIGFTTSNEVFRGESR